MLETREERVKLLKAGISGKMIEKLYIERNNLKIISLSPVIELLEIDMLLEGNNCIIHEAAAKCS